MRNSHFQGGEQGTLGGHGDPGERVVELGERGGEVRAGCSAFDRQCSLTGSGQNGVDRQEVGHLTGPAEAAEPGRGENHRVQFTASYKSDTRIDVATDRHGLDVEAVAAGVRVELRHAARRAGAYAGTGRQLLEGQPVPRHQHVTRILAPRDGSQHEALGLCGRQVLERVDGEVHLASQQRLTQRRDEHAGAADLREMLLGGVSVRGDLDELDGAPGHLADRVGDQAGLRHGELAAPGAQPERRAGLRAG